MQKNLSVKIISERVILRSFEIFFAFCDIEDNCVLK